MDLVEQQADAFTPELIVEDPRDNSGFLQIQHRASAGGFFYSDYSIGDHVTQGTPIGQILDMLGNCIDEVRCNQTGQIMIGMLIGTSFREENLETMKLVAVPILLQTLGLVAAGFLM